MPTSEKLDVIDIMNWFYGCYGVLGYPVDTMLTPADSQWESTIGYFQTSQSV
jgi:hypothetical protein